MMQKANLVPGESFSIIYALYDYNIFSDIDNLQIVKLMTHIFNAIFYFCIMQVFLHFFPINFAEVIETC